MWKWKNCLCWFALLCSIEVFAQPAFELIPQQQPAITYHRGQAIADQTIQTTFLLDKTKRSYTFCVSLEKKVVQQRVVVRTKKRIRQTEWKCWEGKTEIPIEWVDDSTFQFRLPLERKKHYFSFYNSTQLVDKWASCYLPMRTQRVVVVPLVPISSSEKSLEIRVNSIFRQAGIQLDVEFMPVFKTKVFSSRTVFSKPDSLPIYAGQMRLLRDQFFELNPQMPTNAYYLFVIPQFSDATNGGYMIKNKALGFVPFQAREQSLVTQLARTLGIGMGMLEPAWESLDSLENRSENLMDTLGGTQLTMGQISALRSDLRTFSRIDAFENVPTNNGTIAYYFWKESNGWIDLPSTDPLDAIQRPYRKNFLTSRFQLQYTWMKPIYKWGSYYITVFNALFLVGFWILFRIIRKQLRRLWEMNQWRKRFFRKVLVWGFFGGMCYGIYLSFAWGNAIIDQFTIISGPLPELDQQAVETVQKRLLTNPSFRKKRGDELEAEILIQHNTHWEVKKRMPVLYFEVYLDAANRVQKMRFLHNSDTLAVDAWKLSKKVTNHYLVFNYVDKNQQRVQQKVYSYDGNELVQNNFKIDVPKRILVFVNGYRPTSVGHSVEENFQDIFKKGFENKNSSNHIYNFDRYDYWQPWNQINLLLQQRINPTETYYADGHFSVATSNYRSILNFTRIAQVFPKRCSNLKKHTCYWMNNTDVRRYVVQKSHTENMLKMRSNKAGFRYRQAHGKIAGKNLLQILNELPGYSKNDTVYIVAHSMGFAYSLGIVESVRNQIQLGGFYILAPENAKAGTVNTREWKEVWQYGSRFNLENSDAPCLQDGVAPQSGINGLPAKNRLFIPQKNDAKKGFFDSHFVGYFTWILEIPQGEKGAVSQR